MHTHVKTIDCTLSTVDTRTLERRLARIERLVPRVEPDLMHLRLVVERHPRRVEFRCSLTLTLEDAVLSATRQHSPAVHTLLTQAFDRLEGQLNRRREERLDRRTRASQGDVEAAITG